MIWERKKGKSIELTLDEKSGSYLKRLSKLSGVSIGKIVNVIIGMKIIETEWEPQQTIGRPRRETAVSPDRT